jgi:hypothetical protein
VVKVRALTERELKKSSSRSTSNETASPSKRRHRRRKSSAVDADGDTPSDAPRRRNSNSRKLKDSDREHSGGSHHSSGNSTSVDDELMSAPDDTRGWFLYVLVCQRFVMFVKTVSIRSVSGAPFVIRVRPETLPTGLRIGGATLELAELALRLAPPALRPHDQVCFKTVVVDCQVPVFDSYHYYCY